MKNEIVEGILAEVPVRKFCKSYLKIFGETDGQV